MEEAGTVYGPCSESAACAYSASTGHVLWQVPSAALFSPAVANGLVFLVCANQADLCAVQAGSGRSVWAAAPDDGGQIASAPIVSKGVVYVGGLNGMLSAISERTGKILWQYWSSSTDPYAFNPLFGTPVIHNDVIYLSSLVFPVQAVSLETHRLLWVSNGRLAAQGDATPNIADGLVIVSSPPKPLISTAPNVMALPLNGCGSTLCNPRWKDHLGSGGANGTAVAGGIVYTTGTVQNQTYLFALSLATGRKLWTVELPSASGSSTPAVAGNVVYVGTYNGGIDAASAAGCGHSTCPLLWSSQADYPISQEPQPIVVNGRLFMSTGLGLYAFGLAGKGTPEAAMPTAPTDAQATQRYAIATITWTPATSARFPITAYAVTSDPDGYDDFPSPGDFDGDTMRLYDGKTYTFTAVAESAAGTSRPSNRTNSVTATNTPAAPTHVKAAAGNGEVTLTWTPPTDTGGLPITGYVISPFSIPPINVSSPVSEYTVTGLENGTPYAFSVQAVNSLGAGQQGFSPAVTPHA